MPGANKKRFSSYQTRSLPSRTIREPSLLRSNSVPKRLVSDSSDFLNLRPFRRTWMDISFDDLENEWHIGRLKADAGSSQNRYPVICKYTAMSTFYIIHLLRCGPFTSRATWLRNGVYTWCLMLSNKLSNGITIWGIVGHSPHVFQFINGTQANRGRVNLRMSCLLIW